MDLMEKYVQDFKGEGEEKVESGVSDGVGGEYGKVAYIVFGVSIEDVRYVRNSMGSDGIWFCNLFNGATKETKKRKDTISNSLD